jgi:hypothetical protein
MRGCPVPERKIGAVPFMSGMKSGMKGENRPDAIDTDITLHFCFGAEHRVDTLDCRENRGTNQGGTTHEARRRTWRVWRRTTEVGETLGLSFGRVDPRGSVAHYSPANKRGRLFASNLQVVGDGESSRYTSGLNIGDVLVGFIINYAFEGDLAILDDNADRLLHP